MSDTPKALPFAIDYTDMCKACVRAINNAHGHKARTYCHVCRRELAQVDDAAHTWAVVPKAA